MPEADNHRAVILVPVKYVWVVDLIKYPPEHILTEKREK